MLQFAIKSPTSSPGADIDVRRPNIDVELVRKKMALIGISTILCFPLNKQGIVSLMILCGL